jgi:DNA helicase HerA-like ATPase
MNSYELKYPIPIGVDDKGTEFEISAYDLQGLNLILGLKGFGKSHLAKAILLGLTQHRAGCIVFDINDEYSKLDLEKDGQPKNELKGHFVKLKPGETLKFPLADLDSKILNDIMIALGLPEASQAEFYKIVSDVTDVLTIKKLEDKVANVRSEHIRGAIDRRLTVLKEMHLIDDNLNPGKLKNLLLNNLKNQKTVIVNLKGLTKNAMKTTAQILLYYLRRQLEYNKIKPIFLFAEEAHLYIDGSSIEELVTLVRHLGLWQFYVTNTPTSLPQLLIRQTDNLFCFYLNMPNDIEYVAPASKLEPYTFRSIIQKLPFRRFLAIGSATENLPVLLKNIDLEKKGVITAGETKYRFNEL